MTDTAPTILAARIAAELRDVMHKADDDREFREEMLQAITEIRVTTAHLVDRMANHEQDDERRFSSVNQSINGALNMKHVAMACGIAAAIAAAVYFIITVAKAVNT